ncbi:MAG: hypothetical protein AAF607_02070 [Pseudomonadota bacterium]
MTRSVLSLLCALILAVCAPSAGADVFDVRSGIHPTYVRVAFESDDIQIPQMKVEGSEISIAFAQPLADRVGALPDIIAVYEPFVSAWTLAREAGGFTFKATLPPGVKPRLKTFQTLSYIDFEQPQEARAPDLTGVAPNIAAIRTATQSMNTADRQAREKAKREAEMAAQKAAEAAAEQAALAAQASEQRTAEAALTGQAERSRLSALEVKVQNRPFETRLSFMWDVTVPAAIFQRAGSLWVIFENQVDISHPDAVFSQNARVTGVERLDHGFGTVLRYALGPDQHVLAQRENTRWEIEIKDSITRPRNPVVVTRQIDPQDGKRVFFALGEAGSRFVLNDPLVGDTIIAVPSTLDGKGLAAAQTAAGFEALQTAQGVAFAQLGDGVDVRRFRNGAAIYAARGLALSETGAELASASGGERAVRLIDLAGWAGNPNVPEAKRAHALLYAISMAPETNLNSRRAAYARFLVGRGFALDAIGVIEVILQSDPSMAENPTLLAMRGVARLMARRFEAAYEDLMAPALDSEPDAYLWRAIAAEETGRYSEALAYFERGSDVLSLYEPQDQARFQLSAVRAAKALEKAETAETELRRLEALEAPTPYKEWASLMRAKTHLNAGERDNAKRIFGVLAADAPRDVEARARFQLAKLALEDGEANAQDTIDLLERLRFAWRGGPFEIDLLEYLSSLYWDEVNYRDALSMLRQAVTYFPTDGRTREITRTMEERFETLFLDGIADDMDPVTAVALYYDFRELTPLGAMGDKMVRRLADRLVNVELFDRAAQLLEHQVAYRLEGVAQASVAARLAMVHLLNDSPADALRVLRATRASNIPKDLRAERFRIEARALIDTQRYQEAVVALEADKTNAADMLRADASWGGKDWPLVRKTSRKLLAAAGDTLSDDERRHVLRWAIAATLDNMPGELGEIRKRFAARMRGGLYGEAFEAIAGSSADGMQVPRLSGNLADVDTLEAFMESYRAAFRPNSSSAEQTAL